MSQGRSWENSSLYGRHDVLRSFQALNVTQVQEEIERLRRELCLTTRKYNRAKRDILDIKAANNIDRNPFLFLDLPREIRNQIYQHALQAPVHVVTDDRPTEWLNLNDSPYKPPSPQICLLNAQISKEANEVLYGSNTFVFTRPNTLLQFERQIGLINQSSIRHIGLNVLFSDIPSHWQYTHARLHPIFDLHPIPIHWAQALGVSQLRDLDQITITKARIYYKEPGSTPSIVTAAETWTGEERKALMEKNLRVAAIQILGRRRNPVKQPRVNLRMISEEEPDLRNYPQNWVINIMNDASEIEWEARMESDFLHETGSATPQAEIDPNIWFASNYN
jgi:hypothetical protein